MTIQVTERSRLRISATFDFFPPPQIHRRKSRLMTHYDSFGHASAGLNSYPIDRCIISINVFTMSVATWKRELALKFTSLTSAKNVSSLDTVNDVEVHWHTDERVAWLVVVGLFAYALVVLKEFVFGVKAPKVGRRSFWEPRWLIGLRFARNSAPMVLEGYHKVSISHHFKLSVTGGINRLSETTETNSNA